jgi:glycosyltransferase involved in cell wall biosynthesis
MNIVMVTNTYAPHVGGVAHSVAAFSAEYRRHGHRVLIVAPEFPNRAEHEPGVLRIPAIQNFNGSDFSVVLPLSGALKAALDDFAPDIFHAHHPYLLGMTALRNARYRKLPLVFTHHTLYEQYTHYVPGDSPALARFVIELATRYANLTDTVFAPSASIAALIRRRGVEVPIEVVPTGVDLARFSGGEGAHCRDRCGIPRDAFVVGHVGRLAPEKNLGFLAESVARFLAGDAAARFLLVGQGPAEAVIRRLFARQGLLDRLHPAGVLEGAALADAYAAMDVFAFSSFSETQGMVLTEAMAAGVPVVALDAPGVREVVRDGRNGRLLHDDAVPRDFAAALAWVAALDAASREALRGAARELAAACSMSVTARRALACYERLCRQSFIDRAAEFEQWQATLDLIRAEWEIVKGVAGAAGAALGGTDAPAGRSW